MNPVFSIITVVYNNEETIERTIESLLNQEFKDFEYIIIDGKSTDTTNEIIDKYKDQFAGGFTHISEPDNGIYDAMNKGITLAKGELIGLLNADDYYYSDTLLNVHNVFVNTDRKTVLTGELIFKGEKKELLLKTSRERFVKKTKRYMNGLRHPATFVPKLIYDDLGYFDTNYKIAADAELMIRIYKADYQFEFINKPLLVMTDGGASNSKGLYPQLMKENRMLLGTYCSNPVLRIYYIMLAQIRLATKELFSGIIYTIRKLENT